MPLILPSNSISAVGYEVDNSLRFDDGSSDNLTHSFSTPTGNKKHTISFWTKKTVIGGDQFLFAEGSDSNNTARIFFSSDGLRYVSTTSNVDDFKLVTNQVFRDVSAWYHIVITVDTTLATADDRVKMYANGQQITSFASRTNPSINLVTRINSSGTHTISGRGFTSSDFFDGYLAEFCFIDGQALDPTSFGEFDEDTGIWKPKSVSGLTFGTNGFYLSFENSGALGQDDSGNGNNFTVNNLTSIDQTTDTPTNNYATLNPLANYYASHTFSEGNLKIVGNSSTARYSVSTIGVSSGKWYFEAKLTNFTSSPSFVIGIESTIGDYPLGNQASGYGYWQNGQKYNSGTLSSYGNSYTTNDIIGVAVDMDNRYIYFSKNGTFQNSGDPTSGSSGTGSAFNFSVADQYFMAVGETGTAATATWELNFGSPPFTISSGNSDGNGYGNFEYSVPSGYYALNTKNLAEYG